MNYCPITYEPVSGGLYSQAGLRRLSPNLEELHDFPYDEEQQRREAVIRAAKMSIQGVQPKLSVVLRAKVGEFAIVDHGGRLILKPQQGSYPNLPENEGLTMYLAGTCGIETPLNGLVRCSDRSWSYFIRRFDRVGQSRKVPVEDFAQLSGEKRSTKYKLSMERVVRIVDQYCTFPAIEKVKLFKRCLFSYLVGNEDMHLKNFSLISRDGKVELAPAYDFLSTTVAFLALGKRQEEIEEIALPLQGKKRGLDRQVWVRYFGRERLGLKDKIIDAVLYELESSAQVWSESIARSFLPAEQKTMYQDLMMHRFSVLGLFP